MLTPAERAEIDALVTWLETIAPYPEPGCWLESPDFDIDYRGVYCRKHGDRAAHLLQLLRQRTHSGQVVRATGCWTGDEETQFCRTCGTPLDTGGIRDADGFMATIEECAPVGPHEAPFLLHIESSLCGVEQERRWLTLAREAKSNAHPIDGAHQQRALAEERDRGDQ